MKKFIEFINEKWEAHSKTRLGDYTIEFTADYSNGKNTLYGIGLNVIFIDGHESEVSATFNFQEDCCNQLYYNNFKKNKISNTKKLYNDMISVLHNNISKSYEVMFKSFENKLSYENFLKNIKEEKETSINDMTENQKNIKRDELVKTIGYITKKLKDILKEERRNITLYLDGNDRMTEEELKKSYAIIKKEMEKLNSELELKKAELNNYK